MSVSEGLSLRVLCKPTGVNTFTTLLRPKCTFGYAKYFLTRCDSISFSCYLFWEKFTCFRFPYIFPIQLKKKKMLSVLTFRGAERGDFLCPFFSSRRLERQGKFLSGFSRHTYDFIFWPSLSGGCVMRTNVGRKKKK